eukprot:CFRG3236T1
MDLSSAIFVSMRRDGHPANREIHMNISPAASIHTQKHAPSASHPSFPADKEAAEFSPTAQTIPTSHYEHDGTQSTQTHTKIPEIIPLDTSSVVLTPIRTKKSKPSQKLAPLETDKECTSAVVSVRQLLSTCPMRIPNYQRLYVWEADDAVALMSHFHTIAREPASKIKRGNNSAGCISLINTEKSGANKQVIDGQQRLLTIGIIISVVCFLLPDAQRQTRTELAQILRRETDKGEDVLYLDSVGVEECNLFKIALGDIAMNNWKTKMEGVLGIGDHNVCYCTRDGNTMSYMCRRLHSVARAIHKELGSKPAYRHPEMLALVTNRFLDRLTCITATYTYEPNSEFNADIVDKYISLNSNSRPLTDSDIFKAKAYQALGKQAPKARALFGEYDQCGENLLTLFHDKNLTKRNLTANFPSRKVEPLAKVLALKCSIENNRSPVRSCNRVSEIHRDKLWLRTNLKLIRDSPEKVEMLRKIIQYFKCYFHLQKATLGLFFAGKLEEYREHDRILTRMHLIPDTEWHIAVLYVLIAEPNMVVLKEMLFIIEKMAATLFVGQAKLNERYKNWTLVMTALKQYFPCMKILPSGRLWKLEETFSIFTFPEIKNWEGDTDTHMQESVYRIRNTVSQNLSLDRFITMETSVNGEVLYSAVDKRTTIRYLLLRYEESLHMEASTLSFDTVNNILKTQFMHRREDKVDIYDIEHLRPQHAHRWENDEEEAETQFWEQRGRADSIWNLTLVQAMVNSRLGNRLWHDKKILLKKTTNMKMVDELQPFRYWGRHEYTDRRKRICELYRKILYHSVAVDNGHVQDIESSEGIQTQKLHEDKFACMPTTQTQKRVRVDSTGFSRTYCTKENMVQDFEQETLDLPTHDIGRVDREVEEQTDAQGHEPDVLNLELLIDRDFDHRRHRKGLLHTYTKTDSTTNGQSGIQTRWPCTQLQNASLWKPQMCSNDVDLGESGCEQSSLIVILDTPKSSPQHDKGKGADTVRNVAYLEKEMNDKYEYPALREISKPVCLLLDTPSSSPVSGIGQSKH